MFTVMAALWFKNRLNLEAQAKLFKADWNYSIHPSALIYETNV